MIGEVVGLAIITISEAAVTGVGLAFLISYARYLPRTPKVIKPKIYSVYISICWFLIQWFPHSQLRKFNSKFLSRYHDLFLRTANLDIIHPFG
jgi:hypothetical protein